jgi:hypothetical protein
MRHAIMFLQIRELQTVGMGITRVIAEEELVDVVGRAVSGRVSEMHFWAAAVPALRLRPHLPPIVWCLHKTYQTPKAKSLSCWKVGSN